MLTTVGKLVIGTAAVLTTLVGGVAVAWGISDPGPTPTLQDTGPPTITTPAPSWSESSLEPVTPTPTTQAPITAIPPPVAPPRPPVIRHPNPPPPVRPKPPPAPVPPPVAPPPPPVPPPPAAGDIHPGAFCHPPGTGTYRGKIYVCTKTDADPYYRWRRA